VALPRTFACLLENHQTASGAVRIPAPLRPYLGGLEELAPQD
jgi:seryl-tRNA synthetase